MMRSGWWWGSNAWQEFQAEYHGDHPWRDEWKSSPLANDHDFTDAYNGAGKLRPGYQARTYLSRVVDLTVDKEVRWRAVRKSYRPLVHWAQNNFEIGTHYTITPYQTLHRAQFGPVRSDATFALQQRWLDQGYALLVVAVQPEGNAAVAAAYWYVYHHCAYYGSAVKAKDDVMHGIIWESFTMLRDRGVHTVELGQIDGHMNPKEKSIMWFKTGFGGKDKPFTIVRKI